MSRMHSGAFAYRSGSDAAALTLMDPIASDPKTETAPGSRAASGCSETPDVYPLVRHWWGRWLSLPIVVGILFVGLSSKGTLRNEWAAGYREILEWLKRGPAKSPNDQDQVRAVSGANNQSGAGGNP